MVVGANDCLDARKLVYALARLLTLAIDRPGEDEETTEYDDDRRYEPDASPDVAEDDDPEHTKGQKRDRRTGELERVAHGGECTAAAVATQPSRRLGRTDL
jgi:hypothetical protein